MDRPTIVLGLGNPLMGDDGAGLAALEALRGGYEFGEDVQLEDGGALGLALLPLVEDAGSLLVLDAVRFGGRPGTTVVREGAAVPRCFSMKLSPHQTGFRETLALAGLRGKLPQRFALVGVEVAGAEYAEPLSLDVRCALPTMVAAAVALLESWGSAVRPIESPINPRGWGQVGSSQVFFNATR
jgi:hydrogenase maturation protease